MDSTAVSSGVQEQSRKRFVTSHRRTRRTVRAQQVWIHPNLPFSNAADSAHRLQGCRSQSQQSLGWRQGYTLDGSPVHCRSVANCTQHTIWQYEWALIGWVYRQWVITYPAQHISDEWNDRSKFEFALWRNSGCNGGRPGQGNQAFHIKERKTLVFFFPSIFDFRMKNDSNYSPIITLAGY